MIKYRYLCTYCVVKTYQTHKKYMKQLTNQYVSEHER